MATRRMLMRAAGGVALSAWGHPRIASAGSSAATPAGDPAGDMERAIDLLLAERPAVLSPAVRIDLPRRFEQGTTVPFSVAVDSPMTPSDHVQRVSVFAQGNPFPEVARFHFGPENGRASGTTRIRLNRGEQEIAAVAELSDGRVWIARQTIEIGVSGCSAETGVVAGYAMPAPEPRFKVPAVATRDEIIEIRTMIAHWMETGLRTDAGGNPIPRRIIHRMECARDGEPVFAADLSPAVAANGYLNFTMVARGSARLTFTWHEDGGGVYRGTHPLRVI